MQFITGELFLQQITQISTANYYKNALFKKVSLLFRVKSSETFSNQENSM